jgi:hypothetical protein
LNFVHAADKKAADPKAAECKEKCQVKFKACSKGPVKCATKKLKCQKKCKPPSAPRTALTVATTGNGTKIEEHPDVVRTQQYKKCKGECKKCKKSDKTCFSTRTICKAECAKKYLTINAAAVKSKTEARDCATNCRKSICDTGVSGGPCRSKRRKCIVGCFSAYDAANQKIV